MTGLLVVLIPALLLFFMFAMQGIESSLLNTAGSPAESTGDAPTENTGILIPNESIVNGGTPSGVKAA